MKQDDGQDIAQLGSALLTLFKSQSKLLSLEAALAKQSILPLILSTVGLMILTVTTWLLCLTLIAYSCYLATAQVGTSIALTLGLNLCFWTLTFLSVLRFKKRIQFKKTRAHLKQWLGDNL
jgi:uncharacterized membrane protein YqjE